jgi:hypothetical protein
MLQQTSGMNLSAISVMIVLSFYLWRRTTMSNDNEIQSELERLRAENEALKRTTSKGLSLRVSEKGGVSVYGLGRFPVTLYKEQWLRLLDMTSDIRAFIQANETQLKVKGQ